MYTAKVEQGTVSQVIVGDPAWAADRLGGTWVSSATKVGIGWEQYDSGLRPPSPYPSWNWDGNTWNPPVPYPDDGNFYAWDEDAQAWIIEEQI